MPDAETALFVFDVDGTLLTSRLEIAPTTRRAVRALVHAGHRVALASARPPRSVALISDDLPGEVAEIIALNGAFLAHGEEVLRERSIPAPAADALVTRARALGLEINLLSGWEWFVEDFGPGIEAEADIVGYRPTRVDDLDVRAREAAHKILLIGDHDAVRRVRDWAGEALEVEASLSKPTYCEVVARGVSKSGAVEFLAERLGVPRRRVIAFGDGENDLPMVEGAGVGVAMGHAMDAVKRVADLVTDSHDDDGIPRALIELGFLQSGFLVAEGRSDIPSDILQIASTWRLEG